MVSLVETSNARYFELAGSLANQDWRRQSPEGWSLGAELVDGVSDGIDEGPVGEMG